MASWTWYAPDTTSVELNDGVNTFVTNAIDGDMLPEYRQSEVLVPDQDGTVLHNVRVDARTIDLPIVIKDTSWSAVLSRVRALAKKLNAVNGIGTLRYTDGAYIRELSCIYAGGLHGYPDEKMAGVTSLKGVLTFRAFDPFWYSTAQNSNSYTPGTPASFFPFFPLVLSSTDIIASATITNSGDVDAWPVWVITGAGSNITLSNTTTGKSIVSSISLGAGETLTIDTRPGIKTVTKNDGSNQFSTLSNTSNLWPFVPGSNAILIEMQGAGADAGIVVSFYERYLSR